MTWRQAFIKAYMSRGEKRRTGINLSSGNIRTGSSVSAWKQRVQMSLKSLLPRTSARDMRSNESNARTTTNDQSSTNPKQVTAPAEKLTSSNPHLADDTKEAEGNNAMRPHQQEFLATDGDDEEECEEQKAPSRLGQKSEDVGVIPPFKRERVHVHEDDFVYGVIKVVII